MTKSLMVLIGNVQGPQQLKANDLEQLLILRKLNLFKASTAADIGFGICQKNGNRIETAAYKKKFRLIEPMLLIARGNKKSQDSNQTPSKQNLKQKSFQTSFLSNNHFIKNAKMHTHIQ